MKSHWIMLKKKSENVTARGGRKIDKFTMFFGRGELVFAHFKNRPV